MKIFKLKFQIGLTSNILMWILQKDMLGKIWWNNIMEKFDNVIGIILIYIKYRESVVTLHEMCLLMHDYMVWNLDAYGAMMGSLY